MHTGFRRVVAALLASACSTAAVSAFNPFYKLAVVAETNGSTLTYIDPEISINDRGQVAFVGGFPGTGKDNLQRHIYVAKEWGPVVDITPGIGPITYDIGPSCQINNNTQVLAQREDHLSFGVVSYRLEVWDGTTTNAPTLRTCGEVLNTSCPDFDGIFRYASLNNNAYAGIVFSAIAADGSTRQLATDTSDGKFKGGLGTLEVPRPMIGDNRFFVIRRGTTQISYYSPKFSSRLDIAATLGAGGVFADGSLGMRPGVSDDGRIVVFYGALLEAGTNEWSSAAGPGIFAAIVDPTTTPPTVRHRLRIAGLREREKVEDSQGLACNALQDCDGNLEGFEPAVDAAELGWVDNADGTYTSVFFNAFDQDTRVAISKLPDDGSTTNNSDLPFVVLFYATPSRASALNPHAPGQPLLFTANSGLWSVRVDAMYPRTPDSPSGLTSLRYFPRMPRPVVQLGDVIPGGNTITALSVPYDGLAVASTDASGTARTPAVGDHRVAVAVATSAGTTAVLVATLLDSDQDGLLDHWESDGLDIDRDGTPDLDLRAMNASPTRRDLFLEVDWVAPDRPVHVDDSSPDGIVDFYLRPETVQALASLFSDAPLPQSEKIALHIDAGFFTCRKAGTCNMGLAPLAGGQEIKGPVGGAPTTPLHYVLKDRPVGPISDDAAVFSDIKRFYFGAVEKGARELVFHYAVISDVLVRSPPNATAVPDTGGFSEMASLTPASSRPADSSHPQFYRAGNDIAVAFNGRTAEPWDAFWGLQFRTIAHELGHNLALAHGGRDTCTSGTRNGSGFNQACYDPAYTSVMNYVWAYGQNGVSNFGGGDFLQELGVPEPFSGRFGQATLDGERIFLTSGPGADQASGSSRRTIASNTGWQVNVSAPPWDPPAGSASHYVIPMDGFTAPGDPVFPDWSNLDLDFQTSSSAPGISFSPDDFGQALSPGDDGEIRHLDHMFDATSPPSIAIVQPTPGATAALGTFVRVTIDASDRKFAVVDVSARLDVNGDGDTIDPGETNTAAPLGGPLFEALFGPLTGLTGTRVLTAKAVNNKGVPAERDQFVLVSGDAASGRVPDGRAPAGAPLSLTKTGPNSVRLDWSQSCVPTDSDYAIYEGGLASLFNHAPVVCSTAGARTATISPASGNRYFLVVPHNTTVEGSYGLQSDNQERPQGAPSCLPRVLAVCQ